MSGGPVFPYSALPSTGAETFPYVQAVGSMEVEGMGVAASISATETWKLKFLMPPVLPSGTAKLRLLVISQATSGAAKVNPAWGSMAVEENYPTITGEGTNTITWSTGDDQQYKELKVTLDADTIVADEIVAMDLDFESTGWTLAQVSCWFASIIWE